MENTTVPTIVQATLAEQERTNAAIMAAFIADPLIRWMFPDPAEYFTHTPQMARLYAGKAFQHGAAYRSEDFLGAALWLPPGVTPDEEALGGFLQTAVAPGLLAELFGFFEQLGMGHPEEEHWYLPVIGVDPLVQGKGYGTALLARSLEACDQAHKAAYLESSNPRNVPLYQRFGFEVLGDIQVGSSPAVTRMFRKAR